MDTLRIDTGIKRLQINDGPGYLEFNPHDVVFVENFYSLIRRFEEKEKEYSIRSKDIDANTGVNANGIPDNLGDGIALLKDACVFMREEIDRVFGAGTSQNLFGNTMTLDMFGQFFTGLTPYVQAARNERIAKYARPDSKKGSVMK